MFLEWENFHLLSNYPTSWILDLHANAMTSNGEDEQPYWAPLQDNYMLTSSRIKD